ncbi:MAG: Ig-like domain-containing protein [Bryobacteraceae bacterium]|nr:Ig-like domain-containing protein [Bryobacteraceae bacterium]
MSAQNVFVFPASGSGGPLIVYSANPLAQVASLPTIPDPAFALTNPQGTRTYIVGRTGNVQVLNPASNFVEVQRYSVGSTVTAAKLTGDGRYLILAASAVLIVPVAQANGTPIDLPVGIVTAAPSLLPNDVALSVENGNIVFASSSLSRTVAAIEIPTGNILGQQTLNVTPNAIEVAPNGLIYVACSTRLFELDFRNGGLNFVQPGGFAVDADLGRPVFTADGLRAVMASRQEGSSAGVIAVDLRARTVSSAFAGTGVVPTGLVTINDGAVFAVSGGRIYQLSTGPAGTPTVSPLGLPEGALAIAVSDEVPAARYIFVFFANSVYRVDVGSGGIVSGPLTFPAAAASGAFAAPPSSQAVASVRSATLDIPTAPASISYPIVARALDASSRPVRDAAISFSSPTVTVTPNASRTNAQGLAVTRATAPGVTGVYVVRASANASLFTEMNLPVAASAGTQTQFTITGGNGQIINSGGLSQPFQVRLTDSQGNPIQNVSVNWSIRAGLGVTLVGAPSITDANGVATVLLSTTAFAPSTGDLFRPVTIAAAATTDTFSGSLDLYALVYPTTGTPPPPVVQLSSSLGGSGTDLVLGAGAVIPAAFTANVTTGLFPGFAPTPMPNVGIRAFTPAGSGVPNARCQGDPVSTAAGIATCDLVVGNVLGNTQLTVVVGESNSFVYTYNIRVIPGAPARLEIVQGDGQSGNPGTTTPRALVVRVLDAAGNPLSGVPVTWTIVSGDGQLTGVSGNSDIEGRASALVRFGSTPGTITIRAATEGLSASFTATNNVAIGSFTIASGNNQSSNVNAQFAQPLTVRLANAAGAPIAGATIAFAVTNGPVTLSAATAVTDAQGLASVTARAGATTGTAAVTATLGSSVLTFTLTVAPAGPRIESVVNGANFLPGVAPCSVVTIRGAGFSTGLSGSVSGPRVGPQPLTLSGVSVSAAGIPAPLFSVSNTSGGEQINVQWPCESPLGNQTVTVTALGQTASASVTVAAFSPGIFEFSNSANRLQVVANKANGQFVTPESPAVGGETLTAYFTGFGSIAGVFTNSIGLGQTLPTANVVVGINNQGVPVTEAGYAAGLIGVYYVKFTVDPAVSGSGAAQPFAIALRDASGALVFGQSSTIPVR